MILADVEWNKETKILSLIDTWMMDSFLRWTARKEVTDYLNGKIISKGPDENLCFSTYKENIIWKSKKEVSIYFTIESSEPSVERASPYPEF